MEETTGNLDGITMLLVWIILYIIIDVVMLHCVSIRNRASQDKSSL